MENKNYKILILSQLNETINNTLKSSMNIADIIDADISILYVKKPTEIVKGENQLSAMRAINKSYLTANKIINEITKPYSKKYNINHTFIIGNLKSEIEKYIDDNKPDIILFEKKKYKSVDLINDNITQFILKKHKGIIIILENNILDINKELNIGLFNNTKINNKLTKSIINSTQKILKTFKIEEKTNSLKKESDKKTVEYIFAKGNNVIKDISHYLSKSKINLLFVDRKKENLININIKDIINTLDCSLILTT